MHNLPRDPIISQSQRPDNATKCNTTSPVHPSYLSRRSRRSNRSYSAITPRTSMSTRTQQRPRLIQRITIASDGNTLALPTPTLTPASTTRPTCGATTPRCIRGCSRSTNIRCSSNAHTRGPATHPPAHTSPMHSPPFGLTVVVDCDDNFVFARVRGATSWRFWVGEVYKL